MAIKMICGDNIQCSKSKVQKKYRSGAEQTQTSKKSDVHVGSGALKE